jgi:hypothetical protein
MTNLLPAHAHCIVCGEAVAEKDAVSRTVSLPVFAPQEVSSSTSLRPNGTEIVKVQVAAVDFPAHLCQAHADELDLKAAALAEEAERAKARSRLIVVGNAGRTA